MATQTAEKSRRRLPRATGLPMRQMIPNIVTLLALCSGLTAIRFGLEGRFEHAILAIFLAAVFDGLDGRIARLLRATSKIGAELDSLSDLISFGVAPAVLMYLWTMHGVGGPGWAICLMFVVCSALRLARFNVGLGQDAELPAFAFKFFIGVPTPMGAMLVLIPMMMGFSFEEPWFSMPAVTGAFMIVVGLLMVSTLPTFSFKRLRLPYWTVLPLMLFVGLFAGFIISEPWLMLSGLGGLYLCTIPYSVRAYARLKAEAAALREGAGEPALKVAK
ncbi:MAG: CDP-diacylglycerol--serine O-phosphatidyltransferase [Proteobacteria bacterium]|nr:CDP-diacylglycerol--serine O-phosphatidyltransferase [Pseudomonadota bacterium]